MKTALYRHFDAAGALLYVGISLNSIQRTMQHKHGARWFEQIARIDIAWLPTRQDAERAERQAIRDERPKHNVAHVNVHPIRPKRGAWAIRHIGSERLNGWFFNEADANHLLGWFRAVFPQERFYLVEPESAGNFIHRDRELKPMDWQLWTRVAPDYMAGDRYDREAA